MPVSTWGFLFNSNFYINKTDTQTCQVVIGLVYITENESDFKYIFFLLSYLTKRKSVTLQRQIQPESTETKNTCFCPRLPKFNSYLQQVTLPLWTSVSYPDVTQWGNSNAYIIELLENINELTHIKCLEQYLEHHMCKSSIIFNSCY
jgi:hypothetical protein